MTVDYKDIAKAWDSQKPSGRSNGKTFWLAVRVAIEKQIPKKPNEISWGATNCPICGQEFGFNSHFNHCSNCGQTLDWQ